MKLISILKAPSRLVDRYKAYYARTFYTVDPDNIPDTAAGITMGMVAASANNPAEQARIMQMAEGQALAPAVDASPASPDETPTDKGAGNGEV